ncbi:MAG: hypothetical protein Q7K13_05540 [Polynucleobacter sp.]|uniref:COG3904 family protein n=1 Tax=Polynucleobacter sp. TaxID=2029855 RepID=UPI00271CB990|nr:hypothetical protein [Polynucleobacter sp.]MDO8713925.1 hypothetical protein [Polynucleobacter sp.]
MLILRVSCWILWISLAGLTRAQSIEAVNADQVIAESVLQPPPGQVVVIGLTGLISKNALKKIQQSIGQVRGDPIPAGLIVLLDSPGGDGVAAMQIGRLLRAANAHIFVTGQCASACIFVLASGVVRVAPSYSVGIHRGRITLSDSNAKIIQEIDAGESAAAKSALQAFEKQAPVYFSDMGMSPALFPLMQSYQFKGVYRLSASEIMKTGLVGFDKAYLRSRAGFYEQLPAPYRMDSDELERRTMRVASRCSGFEKQHLDFIRCYKQTLRESFVN